MRMMMDGFIEVLVLGGIGPGQQTLTCQLPHIWGIFTHFWPDKWVYHSFTHCHILLCRFATHYFEEMPLILMIFATHFHSYRLRGCEIWAHPEYLGFQITHFEKNLVGKSSSIPPQQWQSWNIVTWMHKKNLTYYYTCWELEGHVLPWLVPSHLSLLATDHPHS